jgi:metal-responsive CopG/Arc/MetJ family transcriptional regulator
MAKKLVNINLDEDLINEIDALSEKMGLSRSAFVNLSMRGIVMGETADTLGKIMASAAGNRKKAKKKKVAAAVS